MKSAIKVLRPLIWSLAVILILQSCKDKGENNPPALTANAKINTWIKEVMDQVYFWLEDMKTPIALDSDPEDYFESLLNKPTDRFSVIYPDFQELMNSLQGTSKEAGYEFLLARESSTNNNVLAFVSYTKKGSPAALKGLTRGDLITQINGVRLTLDNYRDILTKLDEPHSISFFRYNAATDTYDAQTPIDLTPVVFSENPNFLDSIYSVNGEKIGYFVYQYFNPGIEGQSTRYDDEMDAIFAKFKAAGINHLIVDFRYNSGGFESSAINLASLIAPGVTASDVFSKTKFNSFIMQFDEYKNVQRTFRTKSQNLGATLANNRVYIITSSRTASASELIINGLKPFMDVYLVGDVTVGKNVGSVPIDDEENPENKYGMLPIVSKTFNKNDQSDYSNGFQPDIQGIELSQKALFPFGDTNEYLLRLTLNQITGGGFPSSRMELIDRSILGSTLDAHPRSGKLIIEKDFLKF